MTARVLILGGTGEARALATALAAADFTPPCAVITSLAGRTKAPARLPGEIRSGGFGGAEGLASYLRANQIALLVDATHPYAARMGQNAVLAAAAAGVPLLRLDRPAWAPSHGDDWHSFESVSSLIEAMPGYGQHAFVTLGGADLAGFSKAVGMKLTIRAAEAPESLPDHPDLSVILARGPFDLQGERDLLSGRKIDMLVSRNAGGDATSAKLEAARSLGLPVLMLSRPARPETEQVTRVADALRWVARGLTPKKE